MAINPFFKVWWILAKNNFQNQLLTPSSSILFIIGKFINFLFTVVTIFAIFTQTNAINGYNLGQAIIVVVIYNLIESITGFLFRSLYTFRPILLKGDFDLDLLKPLPSFFRPIFSGPDFLDFPLLVVQALALAYYLHSYHIPISISVLTIFILMLICGVVVSFSIHLAIAAFSILTTEIDNLVALYRNFCRAAVVPTDIYGPTFRFILDYIIPITAIFTIPSKAIISLLTPTGYYYGLTFAGLFLIGSLSFWKFALRHYTSASS
jgi:ABC-2 type transport system permease protein